MANKVTFGIKNVHYATFTTSAQGVVTYNTPVALPGAVRIGLEAAGELAEYYADDMRYWVGSENSGYQGTLEVADVPDAFRTTVLGESISTGNGLLVESINDTPQNVALLFEFSGDVKKRRVVLYNCSIARPGIASETNTNVKTPNTPSLQVTASPRADGVVRAFSTDSTPDATFNAWYTSVPVPTDAT